MNRPAQSENSGIVQGCYGRTTPGLDYRAKLHITTAWRLRFLRSLRPKTRLRSHIAKPQSVRRKSESGTVTLLLRFYDMGKINILKKYKDGSLALMCAFCGGEGSSPLTALNDEPPIYHEPCPVCKGKGINIYHTDPEDIFICKCCNGNGRHWDEYGRFHGERCEACNGTGFLLREDISFKDYLWNYVHPKILKVAKERFGSGFFADSVESSFKEINNIIKKIVKKEIGTELDGAQVAERALSLQNPLIELADLSTESGINIQKGYLKIFSGAMTGIRNPKAHENLIISENNANHLLFFASFHGSFAWK